MRLLTGKNRVSRMLFALWFIINTVMFPIMLAIICFPISIIGGICGGILLGCAYYVKTVKEFCETFYSIPTAFPDKRVLFWKGILKMLLYGYNFPKELLGWDHDNKTE